MLILIPYQEIKQILNTNLEITGILITMAHNRTSYAKSIIELIKSTYGDKIRIFDNIIPHSIKASEMSICGQSIYKYNSKGKVSSAYQDLVLEVIGNA